MNFMIFSYIFKTMVELWQQTAQLMWLLGYMKIIFPRWLLGNIFYKTGSPIFIWSKSEGFWFSKFPFYLKWKHMQPKKTQNNLSSTYLIDAIPIG